MRRPRHSGGYLAGATRAFGDQKEGKRVLYPWPRKGTEVKLDPRKVFIKEFEITNIDLPVLGYRVVCSTGTYIRSLANDLGAALGCGAYLSSLRRTRIGEFRIEQALSIPEAEGYIKERLGVDVKPGPAQNG